LGCIVFVGQCFWHFHNLSGLGFKPILQVSADLVHNAHVVANTSASRFGSNLHGAAAYAPDLKGTLM
jgi:hypothetical protein